MSPVPWNRTDPSSELLSSPTIVSTERDSSPSISSLPSLMPSWRQDIAVQQLLVIQVNFHFFFFVFFFDSSRLKFFFQINLIWFVSTGSRLFALFVWVLSYLLSQWAEKMTWLQAIVKEGEFPKGKWNIICDEWPLCPGLFCSLVCYIYLLFPQYDSCSFSCVMRVICSIKGFYIIF